MSAGKLSHLEYAEKARIIFDNPDLAPDLKRELLDNYIEVFKEHYNPYYGISEAQNKAGEYPIMKISFQLDLSGFNLQGVNLKGLDLEGASLAGAYLQYADFTEANLKAADLRSSHLEGAKFDRAVLTGVDFEGARNADISNAIIKKERNISWADSVGRSLVEFEPSASRKENLSEEHGVFTETHQEPSALVEREPSSDPKQQISTESSSFVEALQTREPRDEITRPRASSLTPASSSSSSEWQDHVTKGHRRRGSFVPKATSTVKDFFNYVRPRW